MEEELDDSYLESVLGQFEVVEEVDDKAVKEGEDFMKLLEENMSALLANGSNSQIENQGQPKEFQDTISQTLSKLRTSSNEAEGGAVEDPSMEAMMKELEGLMETGEFEDMFGGLVNQLASKDLLYQPMKDLSLKYPAYLESKRDTLSEEDLKRYTEQSIVVNRIVLVFDGCQAEEPNEEESKIIMELMQEMQQHGNPPTEIMSELAPGMDTEEQLPEECKQM